MKIFSREPKPAPEPAAPQGQHRAFMIIHGNQHTVIDAITRERYTMDPEPAWRKFNELNGVPAQ